MSMHKNTAFCIECGEVREYHILSQRVELEVRGIRFSYVELIAVCEDCEEELYVPEINDANVEERESAYRKAAGLITVRELQDILNKYEIGAGPLAKLMGFGEITINRYMAGKLPSKKHSDQLLMLLASHKEMEKRLEENKDQLSKVAYKKCRDAIDALNMLYDAEKIDVVARYFLRNSCDITPMALQKLLYYAQSFYMAIFHTPLFGDRCQAWAFGPVYPDVYYRYREYGADPNGMPLQDQEEDNVRLTIQEKEFLDAIICAFGCYSGKILSRITHAEKPWILARGNLAPGDRSVTELDPMAINDYFSEIVEKYHIVSPCDIKRYSDEMCSQTLR